MSHSSKGPELKWYERKSKKNFSADQNNEEEKNKKSSAKKINTQIQNNKFKQVKSQTLKSSLPLENYLFNTKKIPSDALEVLAQFDRIISSTRPLTSKQRSLLPKQINDLSHLLTDKRSNRHLTYMNSNSTVTAYVYYYMWWNLVRLVKLFSNLPDEAFDLKDNCVCLDLGSGPLTVVLALFLARPELRSKKITWYCMDLSQVSMSCGEEIFLTVCARFECEPWKIIRVKGELSTPLKEKVDFITCANMFNEVSQEAKITPEELAKKSRDKLLSYFDKNFYESKKSYPRIFIVEPGVPSTARFISSLRAAFIRKNFIPISPCPHALECPMAGLKNTRLGKTGKWCNFSFTTEDAPSSLKKLSLASNLPKERAVLSFFFAKYSENKTTENYLDANKKIEVRITSDAIYLEGNRHGYYACSSKGLLLLETKMQMHSGQLYKIPFDEKNTQVDEKSGALLVKI